MNIELIENNKIFILGNIKIIVIEIIIKFMRINYTIKIIIISTLLS